MLLHRFTARDSALPVLSRRALAAGSVWSLLTALLLSFPANAEDAPVDLPLFETLQDENLKQGADFWIYNDIPRALEQAKREKKPVFVTFRCVPCVDCAAFDAEVAKGREQIEQLARERFVAVRQVEMKGVDLSWFEFDYDLNWAAMFVHPDGTVLARYGTQSAAGADAYNSIVGLEQTMRRVLELYEDYPANRAQLAGKRRSGVAPYTAMDLRELENKPSRRGPTTRRNCIHCHNIHDAQNVAAQKAGRLNGSRLWRFPLPENIGLVIDANDGRRIEQVVKDSPASTAQVAPGEELLSVNGQVITSIADIQWALHTLAEDQSTLVIQTSKTGEHTIALSDQWRTTDLSWRGSMWSISPKMRVWAPQLTKEQARQAGLSGPGAGMAVRWINRQAAGGKAAYDAGLREGDIILAAAGKPIKGTPAQFQMWVKLNYQVGDRLPLTVLRDGRRVELDVPLVE